MSPSTIGVTSECLLFGFKLSRNQRGIDFYTDDEGTYRLWKENLLLKTILTTFHDEFIAQKMIGRGSFAKVYLA